MKRKFEFLVGRVASLALVASFIQPTVATCGLASELLDDPKYLAEHPMLSDYLQKHSDAKAKIKQVPKGFFDHLKTERSQGSVDEILS